MVGPFSGDCDCHCAAGCLPEAVTYPQNSEQRESDFYYALNTPSDQEFYNPVTGLTMLYTDTAFNLGPLDQVGIVQLRSLATCVWQALRYGTDELKAFILRGNTIVLTVEHDGPTDCFDAANKAIVDSWISDLGGSDIATVVTSLHPGACSTQTNQGLIDTPNNLNVGVTDWRVGGSSEFSLSGNAFPVVVNTLGNILVAAVVSTLASNTLKGKVIVFGDENTLTSCAAGIGVAMLYTNVCDIFGRDIAEV